MKNYDVSIIVPIYNVEKFIEKCAITLMEQDYENIEYIFVNDCTPDNSMQVLSDILVKYPNRKDDIKIINNAQNSGSSITRKNGLDIANGEYILFIDSDDWVELDMVSSMLKKAKETDADIVCCDYFMNYKKVEIKKSHYNIYNSKFNTVEYLLVGYISPFLWNKIIKKKLFKNVDFINVNFGTDHLLLIQLFFATTNIEHITKNLYHYNRVNENSITKEDLENFEKMLLKIKCLHSNIYKILIKFNVWDELKVYNYIWLNAIILTRLNNYKKSVKFIDSEAYNIKYIFKNKNFSNYKKVVYLFSYFGLDFIQRISRYFYRKIKKFN